MTACPYCLAPCVAPRSTCTQCGAGHHSDCLTEAGSCAICGANQPAQAVPERPARESLPVAADPGWLRDPGGSDRSGDRSQHDRPTEWTPAEPVAGSAGPWVHADPVDGAAARRGRLPVVIATLAALFAGLGLLVGLVAWAPWEPRPLAPGEVRLAAAPGSVTVTWTPEVDSPDADQYVVFRDGSEVAEVGGASTSYIDGGLIPGTSHDYQVLAVVGSRRSEPTAAAAVDLPAPPPAQLRSQAPTMHSFRLTWSPPPYSPRPDSYVILRDGEAVDTVAGTSTSYTDPRLGLGSSYRFKVAARWADTVSQPSDAVRVKLYATGLQGSRAVTVKARSSGGNFQVGDKWKYRWTFTPKCVGSSCPVRLLGFFGGRSFTMTLRKGFFTYTGTAKVKIMGCPGSSSIAKDTLKVVIRKESNLLPILQFAEETPWRRWNGTMTLQAPYRSAGSRYCPARTFTYSLRSVR